jgi:hypothetical protein
METKFVQVDAELQKTFTGRLKPTPAGLSGARRDLPAPKNARSPQLLSLPENANLGSELNSADGGHRREKKTPNLRGSRVRVATPAWPIGFFYRAAAAAVLR